MFLHIGNGQSVRKNRVIGVFDLDTVSISNVTRDFLSKGEKENRVSYPGTDLPRSFVLLDDGEVKLSRISTVGLKTRINTPLGGLEE